MPVGSLEPNAFGLYDVHGNVWEWTEDCVNIETVNYSGAPTNGNAWTADDCSGRLLRGGSWLVKPSFLRSASRYFDSASRRSSNVGFRAARTN